MGVGFKCKSTVESVIRSIGLSVKLSVRSVDQFNGDFFFIGKSTQRVSEVVQSDN